MCFVNQQFIIITVEHAGFTVHARFLDITVLDGRVVAVLVESLLDKLKYDGALAHAAIAEQHQFVRTHLERVVAGPIPNEVASSRVRRRIGRG